MIMYRYSASNAAYAEHMTVSPANTSEGYAYVGKNRPNVGFMLCPFENDLLVDSIAPIADACDLSDVALTVRVKNNSYINTVNRFVMACSIDGSENILIDSVQRTLLPQESFLYTFSQTVPFIQGVNNIEVSVLFDNDDNINNNII